MLLTAVEYIKGTPTTISETRDKGTLASETRVTAAEIHLTELTQNKTKESRQVREMILGKLPKYMKLEVYGPYGPDF